MEYILEKLGVNQLRTEKIKQIEQQEQMDIVLARMSSTCADQVTSFLFGFRATSRTKHYAIAKAPLTDIFDLLNQETKFSRNIAEQVIKIGNSDDSLVDKCYNLNRLHQLVTTNTK